MEKNFTDFGNKEIVKEKKIPSKLEVAPLYAKCGLDWMGEWIPLRLLRLLEHLAVLKRPITITEDIYIPLFQTDPNLERRQSIFKVGNNFFGRQ